MGNLRIKRGDLLPPLKLILTDGLNPDGTDKLVDLTTATSVKVIAHRNNTMLFARTVTGTADGVVSMDWQPADTATAADLYVEVEVTWPGAKPQTFPPDGYEVVEIIPDLG